MERERERERERALITFRKLISIKYARNKVSYVILFSIMIYRCTEIFVVLSFFSNTGAVYHRFSPRKMTGGKMIDVGLLENIPRRGNEPRSSFPHLGKFSTV